MNSEYTKTVRILKPSKVKTDDRGRSVWVGDVETAELELVNTMMLKKIIDSGDDERRERLEKVAAGKQGVLAHDARDDSFQIIDDDDLKAALEASAGNDEHGRPADVTLEPLMEQADGEDELSLVSTQALRRILRPDAPPEDEDPGIIDDTGFDPYNSS